MRKGAAPPGEGVSAPAVAAAGCYGRILPLCLARCCVTCLRDLLVRPGRLPSKPSSLHLCDA